MGSYFSKYNSLLRKIKDKKIRKLFKKITEDDHHKWDDRSYYMLHDLIDTDFDDIKWRGRFFKIYVLSEPACWLLLLHNKDFLCYIEPIWKSLVDNVYKEESCESEEDKKTTEEFREVFDLINQMYGNRFAL